MVTSLHDGMNLVAKEYVAFKKNNDCVLILSQFAGASQELHGALIINPYDIEESSDAILSALEMPEELQNQKMKLMRRLIIKHQCNKINDRSFIGRNRRNRSDCCN